MLTTTLFELALALVALIGLFLALAYSLDLLYRSFSHFCGDILSFDVSLIKLTTSYIHEYTFHIS